MSCDVFLMLHGWGGNKPEHWQEHLFNKLQADAAKVYYPRMPNPTEPHLDAWQQTLQSEMDTIAADWGDEAQVCVLAHSLGAINWLHYAAANAQVPIPLFDRVLLIAPPYILPQAPPPDAPATVPAFF